MQNLISGAIAVAIFTGLNLLPALGLSCLLGGIAYLLGRRRDRLPWLAAALNALPLPAAIAHIVSGAFFSIWSLFGFLWGIGYGYMGRFGRLVLVSLIAAFLVTSSCVAGGVDLEHQRLPHDPSTLKALTVWIGIIFTVVAGMTMVDVYRIAKRRKNSSAAAEVSENGPTDGGKVN